MIDKDKIDSVFSVALPEMNPEQRESYEHSYEIYRHPKTVFTGPFASMYEGKQNQLLKSIERKAELALNESKAHPVKSSWKEELEQSIPALQKALQLNEERTKGKFLTGQESKALRDARQALSDAQFLLAYASGLVNKSKGQEAKKTTQTFTYNGGNHFVYKALQRLFDKGYLTQRTDKNNTAYFCFRRGAVDNDLLDYNEIKAILKSSGIKGKDSEVVTNFLNEIDFRTYTGTRRITTATELSKLWFHG